jgi:Holliday junction resolvasome RuvABC endonuclease subunit
LIALPRQEFYSIGIDNGTQNNVGWCVLFGDRYRRSGVWRLGTSRIPMENRLDILFAMCSEMFANFSAQPHAAVVGIEEPFLKMNAKTVIALAKSWATIRAAARFHHLPVHGIQPSTAKLAATGDGRADKEKVLRFINSQFGLALSDDNEADAVAIALATRAKHKERAWNSLSRSG